MAVQVDEARRHQPAGGVDRAQRPRRRDVRFDRLDHAVADADVAAAAQPLAGVEHVAVLDDEVELVVGAEGEGGSGDERSGGAGQEAAA
jgi:hypothetical protein